MEPPGNPVRFNGLLPLRRRVASSLPACTRSRARGVLVFGGVGLPRRCVCHDRGPVRIGGPCVSRGAQASGVRPLPPPATRRCRGGRAPLRGAVILDFPNGDKLTEFIKLYLVSYTLGMLARYHPSMWTALLRNEKGDFAQPLLVDALQAIERDFAEYLSRQLTGTVRKLS